MRAMLLGVTLAALVVAPAMAQKAEKVWIGNVQGIGG